MRGYYSWEFQGYAETPAIDHLVILNTKEGMRPVFDRLYSRTKDEVFAVESIDELEVKLVASENKEYSSTDPATKEQTFPFAFKLTITKQAAE